MPLYPHPVPELEVHVLVHERLLFALRDRGYGKTLLNARLPENLLDDSERQRLLGRRPRRGAAFPCAAAVRAANSQTACMA